MRLHPRNSDFVWQDPPGPFSLLTPEQVRAFSERGAFVLEEAFSAAEMTAVQDALDPLEREAERRLKAAGGRLGIARAGEIVFAPHLVARSEALAAFSRHPLLVRLVRELIGPSVRLYWDQLVYKKPGAPEEFPWHQDNGYTFVLPQQYVTCWVALTDADEGNGCPWVAPGIHRFGTLAHTWTELGFRCLEHAPDAVALPLTAGSVAVFSSLTPHRTGPNLSKATRKAYILQYAPDGAVMHPSDRPAEAAANPEWQYLVTPVEAVA